MSTFNLLANIAGGDVANVIIGYKNQLEHAERFAPVLEQIKNVVKVTVSVYGLVDDLTVAYYLERRAFNEILETTGIPGRYCADIYIAVNKLYSTLRIDNLCPFHSDFGEIVPDVDFDYEEFLPYNRIKSLKRNKNMLRYLKCPTWGMPSLKHWL